MFGMGWLGDYPDAENFLQLLYGPNASPGPNGANYNDPEFNEKLKVAKTMQPGPKRAAIYSKLAQSVAEEVPILLGVHRTTFVLKHSWLKNYKYSSFNSGNEKYYDIDLKKKKEVMQKKLLRKLLQDNIQEKATASN